MAVAKQSNNAKQNAEPHPNCGHGLAVETLLSEGQPKKCTGRDERHGVNG